MELKLILGTFQLEHSSFRQRQTNLQTIRPNLYNHRTQKSLEIILGLNACIAITKIKKNTILKQVIYLLQIQDKIIRTKVQLVQSLLSLSKSIKNLRVRKLCTF